MLPFDEVVARRGLTSTGALGAFVDFPRNARSWACGETRADGGADPFIRKSERFRGAEVRRTLTFAARNLERHDDTIARAEADHPAAATPRTSGTASWPNENGPVKSVAPATILASRSQVAPTTLPLEDPRRHVCELTDALNYSQRLRFCMSV